MYIKTTAEEKRDKSELNLVLPLFLLVLLALLILSLHSYTSIERTNRHLFTYNFTSGQLPVDTTSSAVIHQEGTRFSLRFDEVGDELRSHIFQSEHYISLAFFFSGLTAIDEAGDRNEQPPLTIIGYRDKAVAETMVISEITIGETITLTFKTLNIQSFLIQMTNVVRNENNTISYAVHLDQIVVSDIKT